MVVAYIAVGSNLGDRQYYIETAVKKIRQLPNTKVRKVSRLRDSAPEGGPPQGVYLNGILELETDLLPYELLAKLQKIETELGRVRSVLNAPRTIDLDIVLYGQMRIEEQALCVPHPRAAGRLFVMDPLREISPAAARQLLSLSRTKRAKPKRLKGAKR